MKWFKVNENSKKKKHVVCIYPEKRIFSVSLYHCVCQWTSKLPHITTLGSRWQSVHMRRFTAEPDISCHKVCHHHAAVPAWCHAKQKWQFTAKMFPLSMSFLPSSPSLVFWAFFSAVAPSVCPPASLSFRVASFDYLPWPWSAKRFSDTENTTTQDKIWHFRENTYIRSSRHTFIILLH